MRNGDKQEEGPTAHRMLNAPGAAGRCGAAYYVIREGYEVARRNGSTVALVLVPDC